MTVIATKLPYLSNFCSCIVQSVSCVIFMLVLAQRMVLALGHLWMLCIDILRSVPWTVVRPSGCFLLFLSCIVFLFSSAAALVANKDYYYYYYILLLLAPPAVWVWHARVIHPRDSPVRRGYS